VITEKTYVLEKQGSMLSKLQDYNQLLKLRLSFIVVLSASLAYVLASATLDWPRLWWLVLGGFLVTGASNGFNQIIEKDLDKLMTRTFKRPLPDLRMNVQEAFWASIVMGFVGIAILTFKMNPLCGLLGALSLLSYALVYTPLKRVTPFAVFVGAFPGAMPPLLGWVAATGKVEMGAWVLFAIQFIWQFPHFWAIAWVLDDDYRKAGFKMLPSAGGRDRRSAYQIFVYTLGLIPISLVPYFFNMTGSTSAIIIAATGVVFMLQAARLYMNCSVKAASQLMFGSFVYLPIVLIALVCDKI
jgi:protoheme IX farnesyltransferase